MCWAGMRQVWCGSPSALPALRPFTGGSLLPRQRCQSHAVRIQEWFEGAPRHVMSEFREDTQSVEHPQRLPPRQSLSAHILRPKALLALGAVLLLLYTLLWGDRFVVSQLGPFAPLALVVLAAGLLAL